MTRPLAPGRSVVLGLVLVAAVSRGAAQAPTPGLSDAEVMAAIAAGSTGAKIDTVACGPLGNGYGFKVHALGPANRIQLAAVDAKKKYKPLALGDVSAADRAPTLLIVSTPLQPAMAAGSLQVQPPATHIVLKSKPPSGQAAIVLQPIAFELVPAEWTNLLGGRVTSTGISATFDLAAFRAIPHADVDVVTITDHGERRCNLDAAKRAKIR